MVYKWKVGRHLVLLANRITSVRTRRFWFYTRPIVRNPHGASTPRPRGVVRIGLEVHGGFEVVI